MVARRGAKKTRRRRDTRFNILSVVESVVYGSIITNAAFNTNLIGFFTEPTGASGRSLRDLIANPEASFNEVSMRLTNPEIILGAATQSILVGFFFKIFNKTMRTPKRKVNAGLKMLGVPVKV